MFHQAVKHYWVKKQGLFFTLQFQEFQINRYAFFAF